MKSTQTSMFGVYGVNSFHNSVKETDERKLSVYEETNRRQNKIILEFFRTHQGYRWTDDHDKAIEGYTSFELEKEFPRIARESIRRACTDNAKDQFNGNGYLVDSGELRVGIRVHEDGRKVKRSYTVWKYRVNHQNKTTK